MYIPVKLSPIFYAKATPDFPVKINPYLLFIFIFGGELDIQKGLGEELTLQTTSKPGNHRQNDITGVGKQSQDIFRAR